MAENTTDWAGLLGTALSAWLGGRGGSGSVPNQYPVQLTPEDKYWNDQRKALYEAGGSPQMKAAASAAQQFLGGMPTTANPQFASPMMRGQQFAGGIQLPRIDLSKFDFGRPMSGASGGGGPEVGGSGNDPIGPRGSSDQPSSGSYNGSDHWMDTRPSNPNRQWADGSDRGFYEFQQWWDDYKSQHPNWAQLGVGAVMGAAGALFGPMAANYLRKSLTGDRNTIPAPTNTWANVAKNAPGTQSPNGAPPPPTYTPAPKSWTQGAYRPVPGTGVVQGPNGRYAGGGNPYPVDSTVVPFGGGGEGRFILPSHPTSDPINPAYVYGYQ